MKKSPAICLLILIIFFTSFTKYHTAGIINYSPIGQDTIHYPEEKHFKNIRQLTFGGDNAEAYFSYDGKWLIFQKSSVKEGIPCDQMFIGKIPTSPDEKFEPKPI